MVSEEEKKKNGIGLWEGKVCKDAQSRFYSVSYFFLESPYFSAMRKWVYELLVCYLNSYEKNPVEAQASFYKNCYHQNMKFVRILGMDSSISASLIKISIWSSGAVSSDMAWQDNIILVVGMCLYLLIHRVVTNFMVWDSQEHAVKGFQASKYHIQSSLGLRNIVSTTPEASGKEICDP